MKHIDIIIALLLGAAIGCGYFAYKATYDFGAPRIVHDHDANGNPVTAFVYDADKCPDNTAAACVVTYSIVPSVAFVYLGGNDRVWKHERAHIRGMKHTDWSRSGKTYCATVTESGRDSGYVAGKVICAGFDGSDFVAEAK